MKIIIMNFALIVFLILPVTSSERAPNTNSVITLDHVNRIGSSLFIPVSISISSIENYFLGSNYAAKKNSQIMENLSFTKAQENLFRNYSHHNKISYENLNTLTYTF